MINFSIDYLTRKDEASSEDGSPRSSPLQNSSLGNFNIPTSNELGGAPVPAMKGPARTSPKDKPSHSYIALISMAILNSKDKRILLGDIYEYIMREFPYYKNEDKAWKNSIRHNLSLNECFIKNGRAENGKGNYWSIHPACIEDFSKGDFRRRQARRRARKSAMTEVTSTSYNMSHRSNLEYVPMTSSSLPGTQYSAVPERPPISSAPSMMQPSFMYPALMSSTTNHIPMPFEPNQSGLANSILHNPYMPGAGYPGW